ncbi:MAG TPA: helix-hairpin-helix domain-containing protein [Kofleriaceae bacterium]|nr:helix-hairpin-helix domain-containing protein [Kofleriaceae bacterium]
MTKMKMMMQRASIAIAALMLVVVAGTTWLGSGPALASPSVVAAATSGDDVPDRPAKRSAKTVSGKLNLNTATADQLVLLPGVGPTKADRIVDWRTKHGAFKRVADLRHVKGFGFKTLKKLEPYLDVKGENTLKAE